MLYWKRVFLGLCAIITLITLPITLPLYMLGLVFDWAERDSHA